MYHFCRAFLAPLHGLGFWAAVVLQHKALTGFLMMHHVLKWCIDAADPCMTDGSINVSVDAGPKSVFSIKNLLKSWAYPEESHCE